MSRKRFLPIVSVLMVVCLLIGINTVSGYAANDSAEYVEGIVYTFGEKEKYDFSGSRSVVVQPQSGTKSTKTYGLFSISGTISSDGVHEGFPSYKVNSGVVTLTYAYTDAMLKQRETQWHLVEDKSKQIDSISLPSSIKHGALILQTSKDGVKWLDDCVLTNVFEDTPNQDAPFYTAKDIQIINGCYYRVIVAYKTAKTVGQNQVLFVKTDDVEYQSNLEVYRFYLHGASISEVKETETKRLGTLVRAEKENNGYSGSKDIVKKDPHYSWELGHFFVSGWTRETKDDLGIPVFLKTVGDQIVLWFDLEQDIDQLNGNDALSIADDNKGYDQYFQTQPTDMGRGTLIIRYTDEKGIKHTLEIYTNYLEANTTTSANTIVKLFEEGDYEVALDYRIKNAPRRVVGVDVVPEYADYRISFRFSVRNGNCMVFPFDVSTGAELTDESITPNGFKLDMAKSKYLDIDVTYARVMPGAHGYVEDVRFNRPSKDGDSYTDEGIYTFSVKNRYTGESTTKRIYVGDADYLLALSRNGVGVAELNDYIAKGYLLEADGTLVNPTPTPASTDMTMPVPTVSVSPASKMMTEGETTAMTSTQPQAAKSFGQQGIIIIVAASAGVIVTCAVFFAVLRKKSNVK